MTPNQRTQLQRANARERKARQTAERAAKKNLGLKAKIEELEAEVQRLQKELDEARKPKPKRRTRKPKVKAPEPEVQEQTNGNDSE